MRARVTSTADLSNPAIIGNGVNPPSDGVVYPEEDEERVGESDLHMIALAYLVSVLKQLFAAAHDARGRRSRGPPLAGRAPAPPGRQPRTRSAAWRSARCGLDRRGRAAYAG